jgi:hypothetical protein
MDDYLESYRNEFTRIKATGGAKTHLNDLLCLVNDKSTAPMTNIQMNLYRTLVDEITMALNKPDQESFPSSSTF